MSVGYSSRNGNSERGEKTTNLVDREGQDKDLREVFETARGAYGPAADDAFVLQKRTLRLARTLFETLPEAFRT